MNAEERLRMALAEVAPDLSVWSVDDAVIHASRAGAVVHDADRPIVAKAYDLTEIPEHQRCWVCAKETP